MPGGLWVPGAVWEFRQNVRALPTAGVQVVQSSSEPSAWQWEYTIQEDDLPLVDTVGRGDVPPDMLYGCLLNFWFLNNSGGTRNYNCRVQVQSQTLGTFQSAVATRSSVANNSYVYFSPLIHSVGAGTTLRARLWGTAAHDLVGIRLILVPLVVPTVSDVLLLGETLAWASTPNVGLSLLVVGTAGWNLSTQSALSSVRLDSALVLGAIVLAALSTQWTGGIMGWLGTTIWGTVRAVVVGSSNTSSLYANGLYGVSDLTFRLVDVRFGHLFRNLAGVSKF